MELLQSARLVSLGQTTAGVAHELGQPLAAISTTAGDVYLRLKENIDLPKDRLKTMMQDVMRLVQRMVGTVDHLRVFSREDQNRIRETFSVNDAIQNSLKLIATQLQDQDIHLILDLSENLPPISGHPQQMEQVILNLLVNGRDALDEMGEEAQKTITINTVYQAPNQILTEVSEFIMIGQFYTRGEN